MGLKKALSAFLTRRQNAGQLDSASKNQKLISKVYPANTQWKAFTPLDGKKVFRYFSADIAVANGCVSCHNQWEQDDVVKSDREEAGVEVGKSFQLYELMGALSITVPMD